jgi:signal transduction histidine kinase
MLHDFLKANRTVLVDRCRVMVGRRSDPKATEEELAHGIPIFLDQLIETLTSEQTPESQDKSLTVRNARGEVASDVGTTAALHGRDLFLEGFTIEQVVRDYGDVCQAVTNLAVETGAQISVDEFRTFNRCLDNAIAGAVTEYARHTPAANDDGLHLNSRIWPLAHELRNYLHTAILAVTAIKTGGVSIGGATAAVLDRSLMAMRNLVDRSLAEVRVAAGLPPRLQPIRLARFLGEVEAAASLDARARGCRFRAAPVKDDIVIDVDPEMLAAAIGNLLHNAFKFTIRHTEVWLRAEASETRVAIEVEDHCGGLPKGEPDKLLLPFVQSGADRSGVGLGLDICRRSVEAMHGLLRIRDLPGCGCIFTIDLPRHMQSNSLSALPHRAGGASVQ